jgi:hypothetical protein
MILKEGHKMSTALVLFVDHLINEMEFENLIHPEGYLENACTHGEEWKFDPIATMKFIDMLKERDRKINYSSIYRPWFRYHYGLNPFLEKDPFKILMTS